MSEKDSLFDDVNAEQPTQSARQDAANPFPSQRADHSDLAMQLSQAQRQVGNLMVCLLVVCGTLAVFLLQQVRYARADLKLLHAQLPQIAQTEEAIATYREQALPAQAQFIQQLGEYAKTHPDIVPILARHGLVRPMPASTGTGPGPAPTP